MRSNRPVALFVATLLVATACATTTGPVMVVSDSWLVDPRFAAPVPEPLARRFDAAWIAFVEGRYETADRGFAEILERNPRLEAAILGRTAIALQQRDLARAGSLVETISSESAAAAVYRAEVAALAGDIGRSYEIYRSIEASLPEASKQRLGELRVRYFNELFAAAAGAEDREAVKLLRQAMEIIPEAEAARIALVQRLIRSGSHEEARRELEPLFDRGMTDRIEVQEALVEIEVARGRYQEALVRLERLAKRSPSPRLEQRLTEIRQLWHRANLPPRYHRAAASTALTRAEVAVLAFWHIDAVRFAQAPEPPIAVDIADVAGREELVRAMALRLFPVDPVTRRVDPQRMVTALQMTRIGEQLLMLRGVPPCAAAVPADELRRGEKMLAACGMPVGPLVAEPDAPLSAQAAIRLFEAINALLSMKQ